MQNWTGVSQTWQAGTDNNASNQQAFVTPAVKKVMKDGSEVDFPQFNAMEWSSRTDANYNIDGNMWAPDVIWNPLMKKWCMYLSINGEAWHSSIILLTSSNITGPYLYQGPVVVCGFQDSGHSYKGTDLELAIGTQSSLPARYAVGSGWGNRWPHTIDPAVFYDEDDNLWMVYGSWSGGIWMLQLDKTTGLRDYNVSYPVTGSGDGVTSDPYFGTKIAGGYYVSGEGPYIEHIGNYYYLFVSYGFYSPDGGYEMRVFRSENPNGPYKDAMNRSAVFTSRVKNYGAGTDTRGMKLMGSYNNWGFMTVGECAQGHNSVIAANDGRTYLVYHTKFNDGTAGHKVRTHQLFQTKNGWLVAAPFEYNGETTTDVDIANQQLVDKADIPGTYQVLFHKYKMDYEKFEEVTPVQLTLSADGKVSGARTGTWKLDSDLGDEGTSYLTLTLNSVSYTGVLYEEVMDSKSIKTIAFSVIANSGFSVWGYKFRDDYTVAWQLNNQKLPVTNNQRVNKNMDLYGMLLPDVTNLSLTWTTSHPDIISEHGKYYPVGLQQDTMVTLTARLASGRYFWQQEYQVNALSETNSQTPVATWNEGMLAHYTFDGDDPLANSLNMDEKAQLLNKSTTKKPALEQGDPLRNGNVVHLSFGANGKESYVAFPNPLKGKPLTDGATVSFFVKRTNANLWDALFGLVSGTARLFMTGNLYLGFNDGKTAADGVYNNWIDINHPETVENSDLTIGRWHLVTVTFDRKKTSAGGINIYIDAVKHTDKYKGSLNGTAFTAKTGFDYNLIADHLSACDELWLGNGSFWGSADACFDNVIVYDRALASYEITALNQMINRSDVSGLSSGIATRSQVQRTASNAVYNLQGQCLTNSQLPSLSSELKKGLYIRNGKKFIVR